MNNYWRIGGSVAGIVIVLIALLLFLGTATPAPLSAVKTFITLVETDDFEGAYSKYHADLREQESLPEFTEVWESRSSFLKEANALWSTEIEENVATIEGRFSANGRQSWSVEFRLLKQGETWQIAGYELTDEVSSLMPDNRVAGFVMGSA